MSFVLTEEQKEKLQKLEKEMAAKTEYEKQNKERKEKLSQDTNIPVDLVDSECVKIGLLLGLLKRKSTTNKTSLLDIIFPKPKELSHPQLPWKPFQRIKEVERNRLLQNFYLSQQTQFNKWSAGLIRISLTKLNEITEIEVKNYKIEEVVSLTKELLLAIFDDIVETKDDGQIEDLFKILNTLFGLLNISEYQNLLSSISTKLSSLNMTPTKYMSSIDLRLVIYPTIKTNEVIDTECSTLFQREIILQTLKYDKLEPFTFSQLVKKCCVPALMLLPVTKVLEFTIVNPFKNSSIIFLDPLNNSEKDWSFYLLKEITKDNFRLWVLDCDLAVLTKKLHQEVCVYLIDLFKTIYFSVFRTGVMIKNFYECNGYSSIFKNILNNLSFITKVKHLQSFIKQVVKMKSFGEPTEYDYFDSLNFRFNTPSCVYSFEKAIKAIFPKISVENLNLLITTFDRS